MEINPYTVTEKNYSFYRLSRRCNLEGTFGTEITSNSRSPKLVCTLKVLNS